jgi:hypothetical protein
MVGHLNDPEVIMQQPQPTQWQNLPRRTRRTLVIAFIVAVYGVLSYSGVAPTVPELVDGGPGVLVPVGDVAPDAPTIDIPTVPALPDGPTADIPTPALDAPVLPAGM